MYLNSTLEFNGELNAVINRADGTTEDHGKISTSTISLNDAWTKVKHSKPFWERTYLEVKGYMPWLLGAGALAYAFHSGHLDTAQMALVTTAGINALATNFVSASPLLTAFTYIDCGTGVTAAAIGDTALQTPAGTARVTNANTNPVSGSVKNIGTVAFTGSLAITEYGLFSAASAGTLWDHRIFSALNVNNGDSITFTYTCVCTAGGS